MGKGDSKRNSGKRRWKRQNHHNQMAAASMNDIVEQVRADGFSHQPTNNISKDVTKMFKIDSGPEPNQPLDPKRFHKGPNQPMALIDQMKVDRMVRYGIPETKKETNDDEVFDLWNDAIKPQYTKPAVLVTKKTYNIPVLIQPHSGQSINPSLKAQEDLMKTIVEQVEIKRKDHGPRKNAPILVKQVKPRSKKQAEEFRQVKAIRDAKAKAIDSRNAGKYFREAIKYGNIEQPLILSKRRAEFEETKSKIARGEKLPTKRHLGRTKYQARALDFKELDEVEPKSSRVVATNEALREQYDSVYRRGLLEPMTKRRLKKRFSLPPIKYHSDPNQSRRDAQIGLTDTFGIIGDLRKKK